MESILGKQGHCPRFRDKLIEKVVEAVPVSRTKFLRTKSSRGFTLIELLIVIAIILILIAIALPNFLEAQIRAKVARAKADLRSYSTAMESYFLDFKMYPHDSSQGNLELTTPIAYITNVPMDPFGASYTKSG
ncbi:MAG: prepilin-type N-terminal cleavage/methylation domain-containing protein, partial [Candidatus Omnitrophica bacterium]|nr:prepilin-type N-terminal cleavage/methylation domain-containing protein [Candidatus Omnitrophota bacterium]